MSRNREISKGPLCTISFTGRLRIQSVDSWKHHEQCLVRHPRSHHRALSSSCTEWRREGLALRTRTCPKNSPLNCPFLFFLITGVGAEERGRRAAPSSFKDIKFTAGARLVTGAYSRGCGGPVQWAGRSGRPACEAWGSRKHTLS